MIREVSLYDISDGRLYMANDMVKADCKGCSGCFACCSGMGSSIVLDPMDIYQLTLGLSLCFEELLKESVELQVVDGLILPNLKMMGDKERCSFLNDEGRCSIHPYRPGICRLFPLGRYYDDNEFKYFLQTKECKNQNRTKIKVKKWIDVPEIKRYEAFILDWHFILKSLRVKLDENGDMQLRKNVGMALVQVFYVNPYDIEQDFYTQFEERKARFSTILAD